MLPRINKKIVVQSFVSIALGSLLLGLFFGALASLQFFFPNVIPFLRFQNTRPLHVSSIVGWIFLASVGTIYYFLMESYGGNKIALNKMKALLMLFLFGGCSLLISFVFGIFGGREYWEGHYVFSIFVIATWIFFLYQFFVKVITIKSDWPVYLWMWSTGVVFFLFTFVEANLWRIPYFGNDIIKDITVQWKSYGALVGSWNMLVYGISIYLIEKITNNQSLGKSRLAFAMYFLGFFNLLFGWAHHIYNVPCPGYIRMISYLVSMTELIILFRILYNARKSLKEANKQFNKTAYLFLFSADIWVLLNLTLALIISVPAINLYTHGTYITVAHAMGSTIGINTFILLGAVVYTIFNEMPGMPRRIYNKIKQFVIVFNVALFLFWISLISAGYEMGQLRLNGNFTHGEIMNNISVQLIGFCASGIALFITGASMIILIFGEQIKLRIQYFKYSSSNNNCN